MKMKTALLWMIVLYLLFALIASTVAHIRPKAVSAEKKAEFAATNFLGASPEGVDRVVLIEQTDTAFNIRVEMLREAKESLDIVYHTVQMGDSTDAFFGELVLAAERGVEVRVLLDGLGGTLNSETKKMARALSSHENIEVRRYSTKHPLKPWGWHTLLHDKFILMDGEMLLLGGRNLGDRFYAPVGYTGKVVDDREVLVWKAKEGPDSVMEQIEEYMEQLWQSDATDPYQEAAAQKSEDYRRGLVEAAERFEERNANFYRGTLAQYKAQSLPTGKVSLIANPIHIGQKEPWVGYQLQQMALAAEELVLIQTPYATANKRLLAALTETSGQAETIILTNSIAGSPNLPAFSNYYYNRKKFIATGAAIYEYQSEHSIHGKSMVFDGRLSAVGSFNLDDRSIYIDTETMLIIDSPEFALELAGAMQHYMDQSLRVGEDNRYLESDTVEPEKIPVLKRAGMFFVSIFSRLFQFLI